MYSRKGWGGNVDPFILVKFIKPDEPAGDPTVSLAVFEWKDRPLTGRPVGDGSGVNIEFLDHVNAGLMQTEGEILHLQLRPR